MERLRKKGHPASPVVIEGRAIARTFWGQGWCHNLERYSDYSNRLPRGRTYVRNGSVVDLQVARGRGEGARVGVEPLHGPGEGRRPCPGRAGRRSCRSCAGGIDSLVELLQGRLSKGVMERICAREDRPLPLARRDPVLLQLPRLGGDVQARGRRALRRRRAARRPAGAALRAARRRRQRAHRPGRQGPLPREEGTGGRESARRGGAVGAVRHRPRRGARARPAPAEARGDDARPREGPDPADRSPGRRAVRVREAPGGGDADGSGWR